MLAEWRIPRKRPWAADIGMPLVSFPAAQAQSGSAQFGPVPADPALAPSFPALYGPPLRRLVVGDRAGRVGVGPLQWAVDFARDTALPIKVVGVEPWPTHCESLSELRTAERRSRQRARQYMAALLAAVGASESELRIETELRSGSARTALYDEVGPGDLLIVGDPLPSVMGARLRRRLLARLWADPPCPVVTIQDRARIPGDRGRRAMPERNGA